MKLTQKILATLLAVVMVLAISIPVFAADADLTGHSYVTYQVFSGTQAKNNAQLASIEWGSGINGAAFLADLKNDALVGSYFSSCNTAAEVATAIKDWPDGSDEAKAIAKLAYNNKSAQSGGTTNLSAGYYLVVDVTEFAVGAANTVRNLALLQLTNKDGFDINCKVSVPEVEKKVKDVDDTTGDVSDWQDSADYDIGDSVPFLITAKLAVISDYETYKLIFHDTLSEGLTYNGDAVVKIDGKVTDAFTIQLLDTHLTVSCNDIKAAGAKDNGVITVEYTAKLNEKAFVNGPGNLNKVYLEYSNDPNYSPYCHGTTGNTPEDEVKVFTYRLAVNKINKAQQALVGATFELFKKINGEYVSVAEIKGAAFSRFEWTGIDDGDYMLREVKAPDGYNKIDDVEFTVRATHDTTAAEPVLTSLDGGELFNGDITTGILNAMVVNEAGIVLPETGGRGTTLIYILGVVMLLGASVILVARKRMSNAQ